MAMGKSRVDELQLGLKRGDLFISDQSYSMPPPTGRKTHLASEGHIVLGMYTSEDQ